MTLRLEYPPGATPLDPDEIQGLIPSYISTQGELNAAEQANILEAEAWASGKTHKDILNDSFIRNLHKRMFSKVWRWAGTYRKSDKSIGMPWPQVTSEIQNLCADAAYWIQHSTYGWDELAARVHHRLVAIHPFPNGNGRHARLLTNILLTAHGEKAFTWGERTATDEIGVAGKTRTAYIEALRAADKRQFELLVKFVRS